MKNKDWVAWLMRSYRITFLMIGLLLVLGFVIWFARRRRK